MRSIKFVCAFGILAALCLIAACILLLEGDAQTVVSHIFFFISEENCTPSFFGTLAVVLCLPALFLGYRAYDHAYNTAQSRRQNDE